MKRLLVLLLLGACSKEGRLNEALKPVREALTRGDTLGAAKAYLNALNDRLTAAALVSEDVGWEEFLKTGKELIRGLCSLPEDDLPSSWTRVNLSLRILERLYDLRPAEASQLLEKVQRAYDEALKRSLSEAERLWESGDTSGALELLAQAQEALHTPLPQFHRAEKALHLERARLGMEAGRLTPGMSLAQAESLLGKPFSAETAFAALTGRLGVLYKWETLSAFVVDDTIEDVLPNP